MTTTEQLFEALRGGVASIIRGDEKKGYTVEPWSTGSVQPDKKFNALTLKDVRNALNGTEGENPDLPYVEVVPVREPPGRMVAGYILCDEEGALELRDEEGALKKKAPVNGLASRLLGKYVCGGVLHGTILLVPVEYVESEEESE